MPKRRWGLTPEETLDLVRRGIIYDPLDRVPPDFYRDEEESLGDEAEGTSLDKMGRPATPSDGRKPERPSKGKPPKRAAKGRKAS